jgi:hypothetical protein
LAFPAAVVAEAAGGLPPVAIRRTPVAENMRKKNMYWNKKINKNFLE